MKCLEKPAQRRYPTALALADDLRRYLNSEPIAARPPGSWYRLQKYAQRNRTLVGAFVVVSLTLSLGLAGTTYQMIRADGEWKRAEAATEQAKSAARRAGGAERSLSREMVTSLQRLADLAAQRGDYEEALQHLNRARQLGAPDEIDVRVQRLRILAYLDRDAEGREELGILQRIPETASHTGPLLLLQAEMQPIGDQESLDQIRNCLETALQYELPPADRAYIQGKLSDNLPAALQFFDDALRHDPFHPLASYHRMLYLVASADFPRAARQIDAYAQLHPNDPLPATFGSLVHTMNGEFSEARTYIDSMKGTVDAQTIAVYSEVVTLVEEAWPLLEDDNQENVLLQSARWAAVLVRTRGLARRIAEVESGATRPTLDFSMLQRNPILFQATIEPAFSLTGNLILGRHKKRRSDR